MDYKIPSSHRMVLWYVLFRHAITFAMWKLYYIRVSRICIDMYLSYSINALGFQYKCTWFLVHMHLDFSAKAPSFSAYALGF